MNEEKNEFQNILLQTLKKIACKRGVGGGVKWPNIFMQIFLILLWFIADKCVIYTMFGQETGVGVCIGNKVVKVTDDFEL